MKDTLITLFGGGGFVGRYVAQALLRTGARVRLAQRDPREAFFIKPLGGLGQTQFVAADVTRPDTVARAVEGADAVVNLAGTFGPQMAAVQADGARIVAQAAAAAGARGLVHFSAIGADPRSPSAYGRTKGEGEEGVRAAFPAATILRPSMIFGREDQFTNRFAGMIERLPFVPVLRAGFKMQPVYVVDVGHAVVAALADPGRHGGQTYELGGPDVLTMREFHALLARETGRHPRLIELPDSAGGLLARLPGTPISPDQWLMLQQDNVAASDGLKALGVDATPMVTVIGSWLVRYRRGGRFGARPEPA